MSEKQRVSVRSQKRLEERVSPKSTRRTRFIIKSSRHHLHLHFTRKPTIKRKKMKTKKKIIINFHSIFIFFNSPLISLDACLFTISYSFFVFLSSFFFSLCVHFIPRKINLFISNTIRAREKIKTQLNKHLRKGREKKYKANHQPPPCPHASI